ncbi:diguanylate cyclase [Vibrio sp. HN007]|uniref:sensor domain-containing diguanylate cyclase n=1 Tax=Vibrio iocasae TaxID=3098914 RepID=UPI0035D446B3
MENRPCSCPELAAVLNTLPDRVFILSESGVFLDVFGGMDTNVHCNSGKLVGKSLSDIMSHAQANEYVGVISKALSSGKTQNYLYSFSPQEFPVLPDAIIPTKTQWYEGRVHPLNQRHKGENAVIWIARNTTDSYELKQHLKALSEHDDLTELLNRRAFRNQSKQCFACRKRHGTYTTLLLIDIDKFKDVNDKFGHPFGDEVIKSVANILVEEARETDSIGRLGGEEYGILLGYTDLNDAQHVAERIRSRIDEQRFSFFGETTHITVSIGVSQILSSDTDQSAVFHKADAALYESKQNGRNRVTVKI